MPQVTKTVLLLIVYLGCGVGITWGDVPVVNMPLIEFKGPAAKVQLGTIEFKGPQTDPIFLPTIVYQGTTPIKRPPVTVIEKLVLQPQAVNGAFTPVSRVPLKVICSRDPEKRLDYEFQRKVKQQWRTDRTPRLLGIENRRRIGPLTIIRQAKFSKAGKYRWRCRAGNDGAWSAWSSELVIAVPGGRKVKETHRPTTGPAIDTQRRMAD
jgi:hypothetical protein